jgi:hypothetical protein
VLGNRQLYISTGGSKERGADPSDGKEETNKEQQGSVDDCTDREGKCYMHTYIHTYTHTPAHI